MADRYAYLPLVGLSIAAIWIAAEALADRPVFQAFASMGACLALLVMAVMPYRQTSVWKDSETLYEHTLAVTGRNYVIENNLGTVFAAHDRHFEAMGRYEKSIALAPDFAPQRANLGAELIDHGRFDEAFTQLKEALRINPDQPVAEANLGNIYRRRGDFREARELSGALDHCRKALELNPGLRQVRFDFASNLAAAGNRDAAIREYTRLLAIDRSFPGAQAALDGLKGY
jgi:tetratricopeptide (TPR) repeat protein